MALRIENVKVADLIGYERNARIHSESQIQQIALSIDEFGFYNPVLIDDQNQLIAGHGRLEAARSIGMLSVPAIRLSGLDERQQKALRIADNQLALNASWDLDLLASELVELQEDDFGLDVLGFDDDFISGLLSDDDDSSFGGDTDSQSGPGTDDEFVEVSVGPYRIQVKKREFEKWETALRAKVGFDVPDVVGEIKKRLGIKG